jgi:hypothetical protein
MKNNWYKTIVSLAVFAIAMGFLESAVVIYLRVLYYPDGFQFPLRAMSNALLRVEILREAATIIMLVSVGYVVGKTALQRFAAFVFAFAIWDIVYYLGLYVCIGWPLSLNDWDLLFLIPIPWVAPVWAPCVIALIMVIGSLHVLLVSQRDFTFRISGKKWLVMWMGCGICLCTFMCDYFIQHSTSYWLNVVFGNGKVAQGLSTYIPNTFPSFLFLIGTFFFAAPIFHSIYTHLKSK